MAYKKLKIFYNKLNEYESLNKNGVLTNKTSSLELYLLSVKENGKLEERIEVIITLFRWINKDVLFDLNAEQVPVLKIQQFFSILDKNPHLKDKIKNIFSSTLLELHSTEFFCEVGLHSNIGLIGELLEKMTVKILPSRPVGDQLSELMMAIFPDEKHIESFKNLDDEKVERFLELFSNEDYSTLKNDIDDSLIYLISQITAIGLSPAIRKRIPHKKMKSLPFYTLPAKLNLYLKTKSEDQIELNGIVLNELYKLLDESREAIDDVYQHLNTFGVSTQIVFQLEKMKLFLKRVISLLELTNSDKVDALKISRLVVELVEQNLHQKHALSIFSDNATFLAQKIIENNSQTGEHYIAKDRKEHAAMVISAIGGGVLTGFTVYIKDFLVSLKLSPILFGLFSSLNYAGSFLAIQFSGFTLATKQPAATASALAHKLEKINDRENVESVTDEIVFITRTQLAAVFGNLLAVIPMALLITFCWHTLFGEWIITEDVAKYTLHTTDILGPSWIYAVFTGFLLWLSSVFSGLGMNWYSFHQLNHLISHNKKLNYIFGFEKSKKLAHFFEHAITGIVGNITLGVFLGFVPVMFKALGIGLDVRHVTLSTGALAASIPTLGFEVLKSIDFLRAATGILMIGSLNLTVSFTLSLFVAFRAKKISSHKKILIYRSVLKRLYRKPLSFFIP